MREAVVVLNPISGSRAGRSAVARFAARLEAHDVAVRVRATEAPGDGTRIAREEAERGTEVVVAAGGDGTVNEIARGLLLTPDSPTALGILPRGTSNLVARHLRIPLDPEGAARVLLAGEVGAMDVAEADGRTFLACAGVGWDARVVELLSEARRGHIGFRSYARPILRALREYEPRPMRVRAADGSEAEGVLTLVLNTRPYAAFFHPVPQASATDGLLDVLVLSRGGLRDMLRWAYRAARGRLTEDPRATHLRTPRVRIEAQEPLPFQLDGDVGGRTPVDMLVRPGALRVIRPREESS